MLVDNVFDGMLAGAEEKFQRDNARGFDLETDSFVLSLPGIPSEHPAHKYARCRYLGQCL